MCRGEPFALIALLLSRSKAGGSGREKELKRSLLFTAVVKRKPRYKKKIDSVSSPHKFLQMNYHVEASIMSEVKASILKFLN